MLIIDPDPVARAVSAEALTSVGISVAGAVASGEEALNVARSIEPTILLIDVGVGGMGPATAVRRIRDLLGYRVDVAAQMSFANVDGVVDMISTGTSAFIVKGKLDDLVAAIRAVAAGSGMLSAEASRPLLEEVQRRYESERDRTVELEATVARLEAVSTTDWLTGLRNHGFFWERLGEEIERARRYDRPFAVLMADIDDFKTVNDTYGHAIGDEVLRAVGGAILRSVRDSDVPCRVGGEEFSVIVPETDIEGALRTGERLRVAVHELTIPTVGRISVSVGVAIYPYHSTDGKSLVESADRALYDAKKAGKNCTKLVGGDIPEMQLVAAMGPVVTALLAAIGLKAPSLVERSHRIAQMSVRVGHRIGLSLVDMEQLRSAALLHDIGMLGVSDSVLQKSDTLTPDEWAAVREHAMHGYRLLVDAARPAIADGVRSHHESFDGTGYPDGLAGDEIPLFGRVIHVVDAFEAMQVIRPYREAISSAEALKVLRAEAGSSFDPAVVEALASVLAGGGIDSADTNVIAFPKTAE